MTEYKGPDFIIVPILDFEVCPKTLDTMPIRRISRAELKAEIKKDKIGGWNEEVLKQILTTAKDNI